jgi:hypothetical protein
MRFQNAAVLRVELAPVNRLHASPHQPLQRKLYDPLQPPVGSFGGPNFAKRLGQYGSRHLIHHTEKSGVYTKSLNG